MSPQAKCNNAVCGLLERDIKRWYEIILENQVDLFFLENKKDDKSSDVDPDWLYQDPENLMILITKMILNIFKKTFNFQVST